MSSRAVITEGAKEIAVDDFIDSHLRERPRTVPEMSAYQPEPEPPTHRRVEPGVAPPGPPPEAAWAPAAPPRPGNTAKPHQPAVKTIPMQAVALAPRPAPPPAPPPPASSDDEGGGRTMMLTPEQAEAAARALAVATANTAPQQPLAPPPATGLSGTIMMDAIAPAPAMPPAAPLPAAPLPAGPPAAAPLPAGPPAAALPAQTPTYIAPAVPQGPAPEPAALQPIYEPVPPQPHDLPKKGGAAIWIGIGLALAVAAGVGVAYWQGLIGLPAAGSSSKSTPAATGESTGAAPPARGDPSNTAAAAGAPSAPAPSASATPAASAGGAPPPAPGDEKPLLSFEGALTVTSSIDAEVVVQGQPVGRTNKRLVTRCGPKNVRLRVEGKGWVSPGQPVHITCMQSTSVTIDPSS